MHMHMHNAHATTVGNMSRFLLLLMLQAFQQRADGLCQPLGTGLSARPRVGLLRAAPPPPPPPPRGGLTLVMSGDDDPKDESHDRLMLLQFLRSQPVGGSTFAQKNAAFILGFSSVLSSLFLAAILRDGMLNMGRGGGTRVWAGSGASRRISRPSIRCSVPQLPFICATAVACAWLVNRSAMSSPKWAGR